MSCRYLDEAFIVTGFILCGVSVLTSTAISVDRLLALLLRLRYRHVVTLTRTRALIACLFATSVSSGSIYLWNKSISRIAVDIFGVICLIISIFCYVKIYLTLRQQQYRVLFSQRGPNEGGTPLNIARYKKTVSSIAWVQMVLVACYIPYFIVSIFRLSVVSNGSSIEAVYLATVTQIYLNSSLNPIDQRSEKGNKRHDHSGLLLTCVVTGGFHIYRLEGEKPLNLFELCTTLCHDKEVLKT